MSAPSQWIEAISKLNELTQTRQLGWSISETRAHPIKVIGALNWQHGIEKVPVDAAFVADYQDKKLRITKFQVVSDKSGIGGGLLALSQIGSNDYRLDILDKSGVAVYTVPETIGLADLYKSIQYQVTDVDGLLKSLLS